MLGFEPVSAQDHYPSRVVKLVVPYPAGGSLDAVSRFVAQELTERLNQTFIVENRGGAGGTVGSAAVAQAEPDGYTILMVVDSHAINPSLFPKLSYDAQKDFQPIVLIGKAPLILVVPKSSPYNTASDLIAAARAKPSTLPLGTLGRGSQPDLAGYLFAKQAGVQFAEIPYSGGGAVHKDILSGELQAAFLTQGAIAGLIRNGDLKPLGVTAPERTAMFPQVPTMREQNYDITNQYWFGMVIRAQVPDPIVEKLETTMMQIMASEQFKKRLATIAIDVTPLNRTEFKKYIADETKKWAETISSMNRQVN
jgi:tripartite-type tricarboxylate transporter receptor subunit TctC